MISILSQLLNSNIRFTSDDDEIKFLGQRWHNYVVNVA